MNDKNTKTAKLADYVNIRKATACPTCNSYIYKIPFALDIRCAPYLIRMGDLQYPLDKFKIVSIVNQDIQISSVLGRDEIKVKYLTDIESRKAIFLASLNDYLQEVLGINITI